MGNPMVLQSAILQLFRWHLVYHEGIKDIEVDRCFAREKVVVVELEPATS